MNLENLKVSPAPLELTPDNPSAEITTETPMLPPPLPSTSHFPPPFEQVAPKSIVNKEKTVEQSIIVEKQEIPKEKEMSPINIEMDTSKLEEETSNTDINDKIREPDHALDAITDNDSIGMTTVDKIETIDLQKSYTVTENESVITEIESAISEMNDLTGAAVEEGAMCQAAIENHSLLVEKVLEKAVGDDNDAEDGTWKDVFDAANQKTARIEKAQVSVASSY